MLGVVLSYEPAVRSEANPPVHDCDRLAASPYDDRAVVPAVSDRNIDVEKAIQACKAALNEFPNTPRFQAQLGRALYKANHDEEAADWFRKVAEQRYGYGMYALGAMYAEGHGVPQDDAQAVAWFRKAAEQGNAPAQAWLGVMYREGRGVPQDDAQAVAWFRKAAEQGNAPAQAHLGWMYMAGRGVPQDDAQAVAWFRKAAEQGDAWAQNTLGGMYRAGRGVPQDHAEAKKWYQKAAEQGLAEAKTALAQMASSSQGPASVGDTRSQSELTSQSALTESEAKAVLEPFVTETITSRIDTRDTTLWTNGIVSDLTTRGCWVPHTYDPWGDEYGYVAFSYIHLRERGIADQCKSFLAGAVLLPAQGNRASYAVQITIIAYRAELAKITSILTRNGTAEVEFTVAFKPTEYYKQLTERSPDAVKKGILSSSPTEGTRRATLIKYDQGWRVRD